MASAIEQGFREIYPDAEYVKLPVADGGEGTVEAMVAATGGLLVPLTVTGPLGEPVEAFYGLSGDRQCAFIEMAAASGLGERLPPAQRNPLLTTSSGYRGAYPPCAGRRGKTDHYWYWRQCDQ